MKWIRICCAVVATFGLTSAAQAGFGLFGNHGSCKSCGCADTCQPECCKPVITRPCDVNVYTYQRRCSDIKPPCCDTCCAPETCCAPKKSLCDRLFGGHGGCHKDECCTAAPNCCQPATACNAAPACCAPQACNTAPACCAPQACNAAPACCAPKSCCLTNGCNNGNNCAAPAQCCAPAANNCCAPAACGNGCCDTGCCGKKKHSFFSFCKGKKLFGGHCKKDECCGNGCCDDQCCNDDPCEIAKLIYTSQTACYADDREDAIDKLGDYSCVCHPEIMAAFIYALNDADEEVRAEAADEIGDQLRKNPCCCNADVVAALTCALGDCDDDVRAEAEEALEACGYEIVDGCCNTCCDNCGATSPCGPGAPAAAPAAPMEETAPAPAPPADPKAGYFPRRVQQKQVSAPKRSHRLADLFGLLD